MLEWLVDLRRKAFQGPLALRLMLATTEKTPTHSHHIAKNLLDLFGKPRPTLSTRRRSLLYADDHQIHALAVTCHHGENAPMISAVASPLGSLLADLDLVMQSGRESRDDNRWEQCMLLDRAIDEVRDMLRGEAAFRLSYGDRAFDSLLRFARQQQRALEYAVAAAMGTHWGIRSPRGLPRRAGPPTLARDHIASATPSGSGCAPDNGRDL